MYQMIIVEDKHDQAEAALRLLSRYPRCGEFSRRVLTNAHELEAHIASGEKIDILVMDIDLGMQAPSGIDLVTRYFPAGCGAQVIYLTGYVEYCTRVYRTDHLYFLTKPTRQQDLDDALDKALVNLEAARSLSLSVQVQGSLVLLQPQRIRYLESDRRKVIVYSEGKRVETYATLTQMSRKLPRTFAQCHKSFLVNMVYIAELKKENITLVSGETIPVSQKKSKLMREAFLNYLQTRLSL